MQSPAVSQAGLFGDGNFDIARWMHQLGFVHRKEQKVLRQLITFSPASSIWALRQRLHQPLAADQEQRLSQVVHLQHVPTLITQELRPEVWCQGFAQIAPHMGSLTALKSIELAHVPILTSPHLSREVLGVISLATQLQDLCLFNTGRLQEESFLMLQLSLSSLRQLRALQLNGLELQGTWFGDIWCLLMKHSHLTSLDLSHNVLGPQLSAMPKNTAETLPLRELHLYENSLQDGMCQNLFSYFSAMRHLSVLVLRSNRLSFGASAFLQPMQKLHSLAELDVSHNSIEDKGAGLLSAQLQQITCLTRLDVSSNQISNDGFQLLSTLHCWPHNQVGYASQLPILCPCSVLHPMCCACVVLSGNALFVL